MRKNKKNKPAPSKEKDSFLGSAGRNMTYRVKKRKEVYRMRAKKLRTKVVGLVAAVMRCV